MVEVIEKYFCGTSSKIEGICLDEIKIETEKRHFDSFVEKLDYLNLKQNHIAT